MRVQRELLTSADVRVLFKTSIIGTLILIFTYAIFIPNNWRRAAMVIVPMALAPLVVPWILGLTPSRVLRRLRGSAHAGQDHRGRPVPAAGSLHGDLRHAHDQHVAHRGYEAKLLNQYRLAKKLGAGGMGEVYLAEHQLLKRPCAIKLIRPDRSAEPQVLARFEREVRATARLSHWNTIEIFDYGRTDDGTFYYVMEYLPGLSLAELVERYGPMPPGAVIYLLRQACDALREAHAGRPDPSRHQAGQPVRRLSRRPAMTSPSCSTSAW